MLYARDFRPALAQTHTFRSKSTIDAYHIFQTHVMIDLREHGVPLHTLRGWKGTCRIVDIYDGDSLQVVLDDRASQ
jgi:hypothetical protein